MVRVLTEVPPPPPQGGDNIPRVEVVEDSPGDNTGDNLLSPPFHHLEAGLAQYEVSDSGSSSSFEVLLPDFSSLGLSDVKQPDSSGTCGEASKGKRSPSPTPEVCPRSTDTR